MVVDEGQRLRMVGWLQEVLGVEETGTLMQYLPGAGWADVATSGELGGEIRELRGERYITIARETRSLFFALVGVLAAYGAGLVAVVRLH